ncbi:hypothetical protein F4804DRAFT_133074 [Jackrogersella minutella]|nr:hypothetical protein F4804DRAFT_133074 [Jackrogersella minutella]
MDGGLDPERHGESAPYSTTNQTVDQIEAIIRAHFALLYRKFTFEGVLGRGAFGITFSVVEKLSGNSYRRLVVKRSLDQRRDDDLRNEIDWLKTLRGAEHIVRMITSRDDPTPTNPIRGTQRLLTQPTRLTIQESLTGLTGPIAVLEYLENADMGRLYRRLLKHNQLLPNRVLWSFFLCLIRACVALAYPIEGGEEQPSQLETIPTDGREPTRIEHADLHPANVMIGNAGGGFREHDVVPPLKFIDFGRTRKGFKGFSENAWQISRGMINLITRQQVRISINITEYQGFRTKATEILHHGNGARYPTLDDDLRDFMARCLADKERDRPSLSQMLQTAENAVRNKTAASFPGQHSETDEAIRDLVQRFIYDADVAEASGS